MGCIDEHKETDNLDLTVQMYKEYLVSRNIADNTIHVYSFAVRQFHRLFHEITDCNLQLYKLYLLEHYKPRTVNLRIRAINSYLHYIHSDESRIVMIKMQQKAYLENVISDGDYEYLKTCLIKDEKWLYYYLIRFMAATGVRVSEVTQITVEDIKKGYKDLYAKGNKIRRIYIPKALQHDASEWMSQKKLFSGPVFLNRSGTVITASGIRAQLKKLSSLYGLNPDVIYPHSFRHRFAKSFIEHGGDISFLSDILGHESIETTRIYLRRTSTEQRNIVNTVVDW